MDEDLENFKLDIEQDSASNPDKESRLESLKYNRGETATNINTNYSRFIRNVKFALPIIAFLLIAITFNWNKFEGNKIVAVEEKDVQPEIRQEIGKNELVNPRFESIDEKGQPFVLTADKAIQDSQSDKEQMQLENPAGELAMNSGEKITLRSDTGNYQQLKEFLDLNQNVILTHSQGYKLTTNTLQIDLAANRAWSEQAVRVTGPEGEINANGIEASAENGTVIFKGPAKMLLTLEKDAMNFGEMMP